MDYTTINNEQKKALNQKYRGRKQVRCRIHPAYQGTSDRECQRVVISYMHEANVALKGCLDNIIRQYNVADFNERVRSEFSAMKEKINKRIEERQLDSVFAKVGTDARNREVRDWKKTVKQLFDIDIEEGYYREGKYQEMTEQWISDNTAMIKGIIDDMITRMTATIIEAHDKGVPVKTLKSKIQHEFDSSKIHARHMARDQMVKLNSQLTRMQHQDAGCDSYVWCSKHDSRVRPCHRSFNGKIFQWSNPPEIWYETSRGRAYTGRHCNPGEDYGCRCHALPVFEINALTLPVKPEKPDKKPAASRQGKRHAGQGGRNGNKRAH